MLRMLNRYRDELASRRCRRSSTPPRGRRSGSCRRKPQPSLTAERAGGRRLAFDVARSQPDRPQAPDRVSVPPRMAARDRADAQRPHGLRVGRVDANGRDRGQRQRRGRPRFEPHYHEIRRADQVQIYESIMADARGAVTTGLLKGARFIKDNRLLPRGFDKAAAPAGHRGPGRRRAAIPTFRRRRPRPVRVDTGGAPGPFTIEVELRYQPIAFRWAQNLAAYDAGEPRRFVSQFDAMASQSSVVVASARVDVP